MLDNYEQNENDVNTEYFQLEKMLEHTIKSYEQDDDDLKFGEQDINTAKMTSPSNVSVEGEKKKKKHQRQYHDDDASSGPKVNHQREKKTTCRQQERKPMGGPELRARLSALHKRFEATRQQSKGSKLRRSGPPELQETFRTTPNGVRTADHDDDISFSPKTKLKVEEKNPTKAPARRPSARSTSKTKSRARSVGPDLPPSAKKNSSRTQKSCKKRKEDGIHDQTDASNPFRSFKNQSEAHSSPSSPYNRKEQSNEQPTLKNVCIIHPKSHYEVLGLWQNCTIADIKKAYRKMALETHPDRCKHANSTGMFQSVQEAYNTLSDDMSRVGYDADMRLGELQTYWM